LGSHSTDLTLESLGMSPKQLDRFREVIRRPHGIILLTGPTGSGKSTTLYAALREINQAHLNILTVEDPIEYLVPGVNQVHVGGTDKVTFASALRSLLRHDPDVLMVGEIRDYETADVALKASMTGHLLFSTLHTNSACGAVTRLVDIGCEPFLVGATLAAAIAQRLVRRLCPRCRRPRRSRSIARALKSSSRADARIAWAAATAGASGCSNHCGSMPN
jgi:type IV pilus assembly protein PilB